KAQNKKAKRFLEKKEPKVNAMLIKGGNANTTVTQVLENVYALKNHREFYKKEKNITRPSEDPSSLEFFSKKSDCSFFMCGSHNKHPSNLVIGCMYDYHVLDMIELSVEKFVSLKDTKNSKCPEGTKPMLIFAGDDFDVTEDYRRLKSLLFFFLLIDFFKGSTVANIRLARLEYVLHFGKVYFQSYKLLLKKSGCRTPRIELEEMGTSLDLVLRRTHPASDDLYKLSMKMAKALKPKKKNMSQDTFGTTYGRIHMQKQDLSKPQARKMKGLKKRPAVRLTEDQEKKSKRIKNN
uniref:Ribosome production factor 2 homolog n=1 Tax=Chinchilla lanigera TaxID=34839 RepID=A0A8C2YQH0_CHILA